MALLFSNVTIRANGEETELLIGGIPKEYDDLEGWSFFDYFMEDLNEEAEVSVHAEAYLYGGGEAVRASPEEIAYLTIRRDNDPRFLADHCTSIENVDFSFSWSPTELFGEEHSEKMEELLNSRSIIRGFVYRNASQEEYWFQGTPENIASFLARFPDADRMILTDATDKFVLNTYGCFIDACQNKQLLEDVMKHLIPIQMGEKEPGELFYPTMEEVTTYYDTKQGMGWMQHE